MLIKSNVLDVDFPWDSIDTLKFNVLENKLLCG